jgi:hypothetical protein
MYPRLGYILSLAAFVFPTSLTRAQEEGPPVRIKSVVVGFRSFVAEEALGRFKVGLWTPIAVDLQAGPRGLSNAELSVETPDSEDVATIYKVAIGALEKNERRTVLTCTKPGNSDGRFRLTIRQNGREVMGPMTAPVQVPMDLAGRLYLTLGARLPALQDALVALQHKRPELGENQDKRDTFPRFAAFETDPSRLPTLALGYDAVDLMILMTTDNNLVQGLLRDADRLKAIAHWVRQGGRLIVSVSWEHQAEVSRLLQAPAWQPPVPVVPPAVPRVKDNALADLSDAAQWAHVGMRFPTPGEDPVPVALLQDGNKPRAEWDVLSEVNGQPIITKMPYGRGSITLLAFDLDKGAFARWPGRKEFLKGLVSNLEPRIPQAAVNQQAGFVANPSQDLTTQLQTRLDKFDVPIIPFGWVALFIIIYILIVGPLDYFLLKRVFKRLEWTWITFPTVVLLVSVISYFTAYAVKGRDLKVNKIDLVDFDLRTDSTADPKAYAYGRTWFTIMSPRIQSYTIGIEPAVSAWWAKSNVPESAEVVSWMGRPELDGPAAMGRPRAQGWSGRSYEYEQGATGLSGVPIPVWTTKSFTASWTSRLPRRPVAADVRYYKGDRRVAGTIQCLLPADLEDVWIFYRNHCFSVEGHKLRCSKDGSAKQTIELVVGPGHVQDIQRWPQQGTLRPAPFAASGFSDPTPLIKDLMFHERIDSGANQRNQALHRLDMSWRLQEEQVKITAAGIREIIVYGRLAPAAGSIEEVVQQHPSASLLWLGEIPGPGKTRPSLAGALVQDTYVRIIIPVRPGE